MIASRETSVFRVKGSEVDPSWTKLPYVAGALLLLVVLADFCSDYLILRQYRLLSDWLADFASISPSHVEELRQSVRGQFIFALVVSSILVVCLVLIVWLARCFQINQQSLRQVKMLAYNILASMERGIITTDKSGIVTSINSSGIRLLGVDFEYVGQPIDRLASAGVLLTDLAHEVLRREVPIRDRDYEGASRQKPGWFEMARGGTLFFYEVGEMPLKTQVNLLRILEGQEVRRLGGEAAIPLDVRLVTATHQDIGELIATGKFREDIYYRLNVVDGRSLTGRVALVTGVSRQRAPSQAHTVTKMRVR